ncbi:nose resistant to fluoxetine protein 6-like isoform 2-T2 [Aphomia sociella]
MVFAMCWIAIFLTLLVRNSFAFEISDEQHDKLPRLFALDEYHKCLRQDGTYCLVKLDLFADPPNELMNFIQAYSRSSHIRHYNYSYLEEGICVTRTCKEYIRDKNLNDPEVIKSVIEACRNESIWNEYGLQARVSQVYNCDRKTDERPVDLLDWLVMGLFVAIIFINISATVYDYILEDKAKLELSKNARLFLCFSIIRNWKFLVSPTSDDPKLKILKGINGVRTLSSFPMILGHVIWIFAMGFLNNPHYFEKTYSIPRFEVLWNGMIIVQVFFVISGFLLVYNMDIGSEVRPIKWKMLPVILLHRFWRLTPGLAVMLAFSATWLRHLGSGPLWHKHVTSVAAGCRKYWWTHILYINNYVPSNKYCAIQTWHIAADTQLFFMGIAVYMLTRTRCRNLVLGLLTILGIVLPAFHVWYRDLDAVLLKTPEFLRTLDNDNFRLLYVYGHNNIICFVLGMFTAYETNKWKRKGYTFANNKVWNYLYRLVIPMFTVCFWFGGLFYEEDSRTPLLFRMLYQGTHRAFLGLVIAFVIMGLVMNMKNYLSAILEWDVWVITGRLTYTVYLLHMNFVHVIAGLQTELTSLNYLIMGDKRASRSPNGK